MSARRMNFGIASYGNPDGLERVLRSIVQTAVTDWHCMVIVNKHPDPAQNAAVQDVLARFTKHSIEPIHPVDQVGDHTNLGYVGAVNRLLEDSVTEYLAYLDHDVTMLTPGWDETMASILDRFHEIGMLFPGWGPYPIDRGPYVEMLWGVGCMWMMPVRIFRDVGEFDCTIGHHEEVDYQTRVRLAGYKIAGAKTIQVSHEAKASNDPAAMMRISKGVINWVTKWCGIFGGKHLHYASPNVLRHEDWPPSALYLEEYWQQHLPNLNENPETIVHAGQEYDLIRVPRLKGFYRHRII